MRRSLTPFFVTAALAVPLAVGGAASAATSHIGVTITAFSISPATINYGDRQVAVSGQLVQYLDQSVGVPDETVEIINSATGSVAGTVTTGTHGSFSGTVTLPDPGRYRAFFPGDSTYGVGESAIISVAVRPLAAAITLNPQPASNVSAGTDLTFTGSARIELSDGTWEPLPGAPVELVLNGGETMAYATTGSGGSFTLPVSATQGGWWQAELQPGPVDWYGASASTADGVTVTHATRVASFSVPATREAHQTYTVTGVAQAWNGSAWIPADAVMVGLYYHFAGQNTWHLAGGAQVSPTGHFSAPAWVRPGHTVWQVRVPKQNLGDVYLASSSGTENSFITDRTYSTLTEVHIFGGSTVASGWVRDWTSSSMETFGTIVGQYVKVYYHPRGTTTWTYLGETRTGSGGSVTFTEYKKLHGYFKLVFPAQGYYLASASNTYLLT